MSANDSPDPIVMSASEVREHFSEVVNRVARGEGRVIVEKHGTPAMGLVPIEDIRRLRNLDAELQTRRDLVERIRARFDGVPEEELDRETEQIFDELREEQRARRARASRVAS